MSNFIATENEYFIGSPKGFFKMENKFFALAKFNDLSFESIGLWCYLANLSQYARSRMELDDDGNPFVIFPIKSIAEFLRCGRDKALAVLRELSDFGLIHRTVASGRSPSRIYVMTSQILGGTYDFTPSATVKKDVLESAQPSSKDVLESAQPSSKDVLESAQPSSKDVLESAQPSSETGIHLIQDPSLQDCDSSVKSSSSGTATTTIPPVISKNYNPQSPWGYVVNILSDVLTEINPSNLPSTCLDQDGTLSPLVDLTIHKFRYTSSQVRQPRPYIRSMVQDILKNWEQEFSHYNSTSVPSPRKAQCGPMMPAQLSASERSKQSAELEAESRANMERLRAIMRGDHLEKPE